MVITAIKQYIGSQRRFEHQLAGRSRNSAKAGKINVPATRFGIQAEAGILLLNSTADLINNLRAGYKCS